jgi:hypothetical protein
VSLFTLSDNGISGVINKSNSNCSPHGLRDRDDDFVIFWLIVSVFLPKCVLEVGEKDKLCVN